MVLMNARVYTSVPQGNSTNLIRTSVSFNNQQITGLQPDSWDFGSFDADIQYLIEAEFVRIDVCHPQIRKTGCDLFSRLVLRQTARHFTELFDRGPTPAVGESRERASVGGYGLLVLRFPTVVFRWLAGGLHPSKFGFFPYAAPFGEDAIEQHGRRLEITYLFAREFSFGRNESALDGRFQHRHAIPLEVRPHPLQRRHRCIELWQERLDLINNPSLFV